MGIATVFLHKRVGVISATITYMLYFMGINN